MLPLDDIVLKDGDGLDAIPGQLDAMTFRLSEYVSGSDVDLSMLALRLARILASAVKAQAWVGKHQREERNADRKILEYAAGQLMDQLVRLQFEAQTTADREEIGRIAGELAATVGLLAECLSLSRTGNDR